MNLVEFREKARFTRRAVWRVCSPRRLAGLLAAPFGGFARRAVRHIYPPVAAATLADATADKFGNRRFSGTDPLLLDTATQTHQHCFVNRWQTIGVLVLIAAGGCRSLPTTMRHVSSDIGCRGNARLTSKEAAHPKITVQREIRGLWVTRWNYKTADDVRRIVRESHQAGFNALFWQVRGQADAFYQSHYEPWSAELTGELGKDPGYDPLRLVLDEAHACGMQVHAWVNVFPIWKGTEMPPHTNPEHIFHLHPEWRAVDDKGQPIELNEHYVFASPGIPAVRAHVIAVIQDLVSQYDVDGLHLDYIRYGGRRYSHDPISLQRFKDEWRAARHESSVVMTFDDFQREQVSETVRAIYQTLKQIRPTAQLSAAVWGIYRNRWNWQGVTEGYCDYYQDPRAWVRDGYMDFVCPMVYWPMTQTPGDKLDWATLTADHVAGCGSAHVVAGIHGNYKFFDEIAREITYARKLSARGVVLFAYPYLAERKYFEDLSAGPFRESRP